MNARRDPFAHIPPCPRGAHNAAVVQVMDDKRYCIRCRVYVAPKVQVAA